MHVTNGAAGPLPAQIYYAHVSDRADAVEAVRKHIGVTRSNDRSPKTCSINGIRRDGNRQRGRRPIGVGRPRPSATAQSSALVGGPKETAPAGDRGPPGPLIGRLRP